MGIKFVTLPFVVDSRMGWGENPYPYEKLGVPPGSFLMTTISNHLESRLTRQMCHAISKILQRCPHAYYTPMGPIKDASRQMDIFLKYGVQDRVRFLGHCDEPSQYARSMHLYLNEFPFGSGLGILDAMASECPVVSMYDPEGPPQGRYGGIYFGLEKAVQPGDTDGYVKLACQLYEEEAMYKAWAEHAKMQYEKHTDVESYMQKFEDILVHYLNSSSEK